MFQPVVLSLLQLLLDLLYPVLSGSHASLLFTRDPVTVYDLELKFIRSPYFKLHVPELAYQGLNVGKRGEDYINISALLAHRRRC